MNDNRRGKNNVNYRHGYTGTRTHESWGKMRIRCNNPKDHAYPRYGGRGIKVCERWNRFINFLADMGERPAGTSLDRINNNGNYEPGNCRWATPKEQVSNQERTKLLTYKGETLCLEDWAKRVGISRCTIQRRIKNFGWTVELALMTPTHASITRQIRG